MSFIKILSWEIFSESFKRMLRHADPFQCFQHETPQKVNWRKYLHFEVGLFRNYASPLQSCFLGLPSPFSTLLFESMLNQCRAHERNSVWLEV